MTSSSVSNYKKVLRSAIAVIKRWIEEGEGRELREWIGNQMPREMVDYCIQVLEDWDIYNGEFLSSGLANHNLILFAFCEIIIGFPGHCGMTKNLTLRRSSADAAFIGRKVGLFFIDYDGWHLIILS